MTSAGLGRAVAAAVDARARLGTRPVESVAAALAEAARRWVADERLVTGLAAPSGLHPSMLRAVLPLVAAMLDEDAMIALARDEREETAARPPAWIAHVLASNVPALAVPAIALACLAGAAVVVKSGHRDTLSAPAFRHALASVDPALAASVVTVAWPHSPALDDVLLDAPLVVLTGRDETVERLAARATGRALAFGTRYSALLLDTARPLDATAVARDVALYEQRGCLSPHVAFVAGDAAGFARDVARALAALATDLPPAPATVDDRAAVRAFLDDARWRGAEVEAGPWGAVLLEPRPVARPTCGARTLRVVPIESVERLPWLLPPHAVECLGTNAGAPPGLRERGVARVCPAGRMQRPPLSWPRGQRPALGALLGRDAPAQMAVES